MKQPALLDERMHDGSRHFAVLPESRGGFRLLLHVLALPGAWPRAYVPSVTETWIDFSYRGCRFSMHNPLGEWWFFVSDPACPEPLLLTVRDHFARLLFSSERR
jgi:hypothetical protein